MRTDAVTLDASCVAKLFLEEPDSPTFRAWCLAMRAAAVRFEAPTLLQFELGSILQREFGDLAAQERGRMLAQALDGIELVPISPEAPFRVDGALTYYDASYAAAAQESGALATDDLKMAKASAGQGGLVRVWTASQRAAAIDKGFVAWLAQHEDDPAAGLAADLRRDPSAIHLQTFLEVWRHLEDVAAPQQSMEALDEAFERFAAVQGKPARASARTLAPGAPAPKTRK